MKRRITVSNLGIHFEVEKVGVVNAHWKDLIGQGLDKNTISHPYIRSFVRFWISVKAGVCLIIKGDFCGTMSIKKWKKQRGIK